MEITDVRVRKLYPTGKMRGIVSVTFDDTFVIHDIKVIEGQSGFFIAMPSRKTPDGEFKDICHPITSSMRREMQSVVLEAYDKAVFEKGEEDQGNQHIELVEDFEEE
ncbi:MULTISPECIES: septation regulator SpoVG [Eubacterium]|uniref:Putative septation protein SpoVG n=1 Tax=Eubacterium barkeri TaxID=1528 RepID=A0A1H3H2H2_EUBBA|nr:septation regulator SpoVG [Eubacterium barkeri]SDY09577.1 stage V sporulation protein G [Eubacterium barkeri]